MHDLMTKRLVAAGVLLVLASTPAMAQRQTLPGTFALAGAEASVSGQMLVTETAPLSASLTITFADLVTGERITDFAEELTQELHVLAVDGSLTRLVHEHVKAATPEGVFSTQMQFPVSGTYHIYADAVPKGHSQQVLRFDVAIGTAGDSSPALERFDTSDEITMTSGDYEVKLDASGLAANEETMLLVAVLKDGTPATDLHPYLGVAAHAVLVRAADLSYVHAHPMEASQTMDHDAHAGASMDQEVHGDHAGPEPGDDLQGHDHGHADTSTTVSPEMTLHMTPPGPGDYTLFIEFIGGNDIHTVAVPIRLPH